MSSSYFIPKGQYDTSATTIVLVETGIGLSSCLYEKKTLTLSLGLSDELR